jgi:pimeloyl-ACP methyl ester carboxylesterase
MNGPVAASGRSPATRRAASLALGAALAIAFAAAAHAAAPAMIPREAYDHPDQLAKLPDGRKLNLRCIGEGSPTVIFESGFSAWSPAWGKAQARVAQVTRACAYDRAGYGFSDPAPLPRDGAAIARDLDRGLRTAGIHGPFVLVGHSAGGLYQRLFAARRRRDVVGLVFVDSSVEHQTERYAQLFGSGAGGFGLTRRRPAHCLEVVEAPASPANEADRAACEALQKPGAPGLGLKAQGWRDQLSELDTLFDRTSDEVDRTGYLLRDIPAIVLTAGKSADGTPPPADDLGEQAWAGFHKELAGRFRHGEQRLVKSGHLMMNERPEVVAAAALELVQRARRPR